MAVLCWLGHRQHLAVLVADSQCTAWVGGAGWAGPMWMNAGGTDRQDSNACCLLPTITSSNGRWVCLPLLLPPLVLSCSIQYFLTVDSTNKAGQAMLPQGPRTTAGADLGDGAADTVDLETDSAAAAEDGTGQ